MKILLAFMMTIATASAQSDLSKLLGQGVLDAFASLTPVSEADKSAILKATALLLMKHVTFRPDGTASSIHTLSGRRHVEWKGLVVKHITMAPITDADRLNGIGKRYRVGFGCEAHRSWDSKTNAWGQWLPIGNVTFPAGLTFDWKGEQWTAAPDFQLKYFMPGPGPSIADQKPRQAQPSGLPPGMTRGR